ncbi:hypothetical protein ST37_19090 [Vibrio sp. qd031]|nr:hypothetical protein ST37_19090 [Vibrio sp. qd031]
MLFSYADGPQKLSQVAIGKQSFNTVLAATSLLFMLMSKRCALVLEQLCKLTYFEAVVIRIETVI